MSSSIQGIRRWYSDTIAPCIPVAVAGGMYVLHGAMIDAGMSPLTVLAGQVSLLALFHIASKQVVEEADVSWVTWSTRISLLSLVGETLLTYKYGAILGIEPAIALIIPRALDFVRLMAVATVHAFNVSSDMGRPTPTMAYMLGLRIIMLVAHACPLAICTSQIFFTAMWSDMVFGRLTDLQLTDMDTVLLVCQTASTIIEMISTVALALAETTQLFVYGIPLHLAWVAPATITTVAIIRELYMQRDVLVRHIAH